VPYAKIPGLTSRSFYYEDTGGSGPVIVFSHGFLMDHEMFDPQIDALKATYRCITWDQRGHGRTAGDRLSPFDFYDSADDLGGLLDFLKIQDATLVGMSQGGFLSLRCALTNPDAVNALILIDTEAGVMSAKQITGNDDLRTIWLTQGFSPALGDMIANEIIGPGLNQQLWPGAGFWIAKWGLTKFVNLVQTFNALITRDDITAVLGAIKTPALVIHGSVDRSIPLSAGQAMAAGLNVTCQVIQGAGHASCLTHPIETNELILPFLASLTPKTR